MLNILVIALLVPAILWTSGAIFFDVAHRTWRGWVYVGSWWLACWLLLVSFKPLWLTSLLLLLFMSGFWCWWFRQAPSHDRDWDPSYARLPLLELSLLELSASNCENILMVRDLRVITNSHEKCEVQYKDRGFGLDDLRGVDALIVFWGSNWICHPITIFDFGPNSHLCFSIEVRYRRGDEYEVLPSLYRQHELMYVVADERDAILRRTRFANGIDCFLYRLHVELDVARELLDEYVEATNRIREQPRWYNAITSNCTTEIFANRREKVPWDWRMLINGRFDEMLYDRGWLDQSLPFSELKSQSHINALANAASWDHFGQEIRAQLPGFRDYHQS